MGDLAQEAYEYEVQETAGLMDALLRDPEKVTNYYDVGVWRVFPHFAAGYPRALVILPSPNADDDDYEQVWQGITSGVLRKLPLSQIVSDALGAQGAEEVARAALGDLQEAAKSRRRDDHYYAMVADAYAKITAAGETRPLPTLSEWTGLGIDTMRTQVSEARKRGILTGVHGRAGGRLTDKAKALLGETGDVGRER